MTLFRQAAFFGLSAGVIVACSCGGGGVEEAPSTVRLRLRYDIGDTLHYRYHVKGTLTHPDTLEGARQESYERTMTVDEVATEVTPRGNYLLTWTYHLPPKPEGEGEDRPDEFALRVEITPQGKILDVGDLGAAREVVGNLDFKTYLDQTQPVFPERPLKVGDSWTQEVRVLSPQAEPVVTRSTYVLRALDDRMAVIAFDGDVYLPVVYEADSLAGKPPQTTEERIRLRGNLHFDHDQGMVRQVETTAQATMTKITMGPGGPVRRNVDMAQESKLSLVEP